MVIFHSFLYVYQRVPDVKLGYVKEAQSCTGGDPWELQVGIIGYDHSIWFVCRCVCVRIYIYMYIYIYTRIYRHTETYTDIHIKYANIYMIISYHIILHIQIYAHIYSNMFPYILIICIYIYDITLHSLPFAALCFHGFLQRQVRAGGVLTAGALLLLIFIIWAPMTLGAGARRLETWDPGWFSWFRETTWNDDCGYTVGEWYANLPLGFLHICDFFCDVVRLNRDRYCLKRWKAIVLSGKQHLWAVKTDQTTSNNHRTWRHTPMRGSRCKDLMSVGTIDESKRKR